jgi:hypothetical protein
MSIRQIQSSEWSSFLDSFSRKYRGALATVQVMGSELGVYSAIRSQPLVGVTAQMTPAPGEIEVIVGDAPDAHVTHVVASPTEVWVEQPTNGEDAAMRINAADGTAVLIDFGSGSQQQVPCYELAAIGVPPVTHE